MAQQTPLYIVASPQPRVGKTLLARLLIEFFRSTERPTVAYDLNPRDPALAGRFPYLVTTVDIADTRGQMVLFDRLLSSEPHTTVVDLGYSPFDQFFAVMAEIDFVREARRQAIEPIVLFVADSAPTTANTYLALRQRLGATFVPVHNESVSVMFSKKEYPATHADCAMIRIPRLSPIVRGVIDRPSFTFASYLHEQRETPTEIHEWVGTVFAEFRELELRLLLGKLKSALDSRPPATAREPRRAPQR